MNNLVILDLDGVIIKGQSQKIFLKYLFKKKIIGIFFYLKIYFWFVLYKLGLVKNPKKIMEYAFNFLKNKTVGEVKELIDDFFEKNLKQCIFSEMVDIINEHKQKGRVILIVSNAAIFIIKKLANFLGINNYIGTQLEIIDGKFTGKILGDIVYGKNKINYIKDFITKNNLNLDNSYAYTDHISDLDLLLMARNPFAVNPDILLMKEAKNKRWSILLFKNIF